MACDIGRDQNFRAMSCDCRSARAGTVAAVISHIGRVSRDFVIRISSTGQFLSQSDSIEFGALSGGASSSAEMGIGKCIVIDRKMSDVPGLLAPDLRGKPCDRTTRIRHCLLGVFHTMMKRRKWSRDQALQWDRIHQGTS